VVAWLCPVDQQDDVFDGSGWNGCLAAASCWSVVGFAIVVPEGWQDDILEG
jgi:hypothetical protein